MTANGNISETGRIHLSTIDEATGETNGEIKVSPESLYRKMCAIVKQCENPGELKKRLADDLGIHHCKVSWVTPAGEGWRDALPFIRSCGNVMVSKSGARVSVTMALTMVID